MKNYSLADRFKNQVDLVLDELTYIPFLASALFFLLGWSIIVNCYDPYGVLYFVTIGMTFCLICAMTYVYFNVYKLPFVFGSIAVGWFLAAGFRIYDYYYILHPVERMRSLGLFDYEHPNNLEFLAVMSSFTLFSIGIVYLFIGINNRINNR